MEIMPPPRNHSLVTAYAILFTTAAGIVGYDLCTHKPRTLPDLPVASVSIEPLQPVSAAAPAPIAALDSAKSDTAHAAKPAHAGVL